MTSVTMEQQGRIVDVSHTHTHTHRPTLTYQSKRAPFLSTLSRGVATQERELLMGWRKSSSRKIKNKKVAGPLSNRRERIGAQGYVCGGGEMYMISLARRTMIPKERKRKEKKRNESFK